MKGRKEQSGGDHSFNTQGVNVVNNITNNYGGLTENDVARIARDVMCSELDKLSGQAAELAHRRLEELVDEKLIPRLTAHNPEGMYAFADPDVQYCLFVVQREYARTGDLDLGDLLVDLLIERTTEPNRTTRQIVLNEALQVAPKLTTEQLACLSVAWFVAEARLPGVTDQVSLRTHLQQDIRPFIDPLTKIDRNSIRHIEYAGCGSVELLGRPVSTLVKSYINHYGRIFSRGFTAEELRLQFIQKKNLDQVPKHIERLLTHIGQGRFVFIESTESSLRDLAESQGAEQEEIELILRLYKKSLMSQPEATTFLRQTDPATVEPLLDIWNRTDIGYLRLTTVGVAIAHANFRRVVGHHPDLAIWIN